MELREWKEAEACWTTDGKVYVGRGEPLQMDDLHSLAWVEQWSQEYHPSEWEEEEEFVL